MQLLADLIEDNSFYDHLVAKYNDKISIISKYGNLLNFIDEEIKRVENEYTQVKFSVSLNGKLLESFPFYQYRNYAYKWISAGDNFPIENIVNNARNSYTQSPNANLSKDQFHEAIVGNLSEGVSYFLYRGLLEEEKQRLLEVRINPIQFDNIPQRVLLLEKLGVIAKLAEKLNMTAHGREMQRVLGYILDIEPESLAKPLRFALRSPSEVNKDKNNPHKRYNYEKLIQICSDLQLKELVSLLMDERDSLQE